MILGEVKVCYIRLVQVRLGWASSSCGYLFTHRRDTQTTDRTDVHSTHCISCKEGVSAFNRVTAAEAVAIKQVH